MAIVTCPKCRGAGVTYSDGSLWDGMLFPGVETVPCEQCGGKGYCEGPSPEITKLWDLFKLEYPSDDDDSAFAEWLLNNGHRD